MATPRVHNITVPRPCHEDWNLMTPEEQGRHCKSCDKVVRDFTQNTREEVLTTLSEKPDLCGRFRTEHLHSAGSSATFVYRFPMERLRTFLLAFVMTFGLGVWGFADNDLETLEPVIAEVQKKPVGEILSATPLPDPTRIYGLVLDERSMEPVAGAVVTAELKGNVIARAVSDSTGFFELRVSKAERKGMSLRVQWLDQMSLRENTPADIREITIFIDGGVETPTVEIMAGESTSSVVRSRTQGISIVTQGSTGITITHHVPDCFCFDDLHNYHHKLHDYIQMRSSEVYTKDY